MESKGGLCYSEDQLYFLSKLSTGIRELTHFVKVKAVLFSA
jgi:hypothetical protein